VFLGSTWDDYFAAGEKYVAGGGKGGWFDSASSTYQSQIEQLATPYETKDGKVVATDSDVEDIFRHTLDVARTLSAKLTPFSDDWASATGNGGFATMSCPSWMLGIIQGNAQGVDSWRVANVFPGGGGNWGGSFLAVPKQGQHQKEAAELASWLTAPEQQIEAFKIAGPFPSRLDALTLPELTGITNEFFGNSPVGQIFSDRSSAITTVAYKGPKYSLISVAATDAIARVEQGTQSIDDAWAQFVDEVGKIK
jgi:cellobiose transport system substrate-binding protein